MSQPRLTLMWPSALLGDLKWTDSRANRYWRSSPNSANSGVLDHHRMVTLAATHIPAPRAAVSSSPTADNHRTRSRGVVAPNVARSLPPSAPEPIEKGEPRPMPETVTLERMHEFYRLGETLPKPMSRIAINGFVATRGFGFTHRRLIAAHVEQCRTLCTHFREAG